MAYLTEAMMKTHAYAEVLTEITRSDTTIVPLAIDEAVAFTKSYLSRFDLPKLFDPNATGYVADANLLAKVKDITVWRCVRLANPNLSIELCRTNYEDAVAWLKDVQIGQTDPAGWPYKPDDEDTDTNENNEVQYISNTKRTQHW